jgi:hypothetical protein
VTQLRTLLQPDGERLYRLQRDETTAELIRLRGSLLIWLVAPWGVTDRLRQPRSTI